MPSNKRTPLRLVEVIRTLFYTPIYVSLGGGFLEKEGLDVDFRTCPPELGHPINALNIGQADIAQSGIMRCIIASDWGAETVPIHFAEINSRDGFFVISRKKHDHFEWDHFTNGKVIPVDFSPMPWASFRYALQSHNIDLSKDVIEFLAHKITSSVRELEGALTRLAAHVTLVGRNVDLEIAEDLLQDLLRASDRRTTIDQIQKKVAEHFNVKISDMHSARRSRTVARPRQIAMFLSKNLTTRSLPEIGRKFGGRDHTTVIHAIKKIQELVKNDSSLSEDIEILTRSLQS